MDPSQYVVLGFELLGLLFILWVFLSIRKDMQPITRNVINGLASKAQMNAALFALAIAMGIQSSLGALAEVAQQSGWVHIGHTCKVVSPFLGTIIAFAVRYGVGAAPGTAPTAIEIKPATTAPFPLPAKPAGS